MPVLSAGILMFRRRAGRPEVLLIHPGGPYWAKKDDGAWSIPKGLAEPGEDIREAARREFEEETGCAPDGELVPLGTFRPTRKLLTAFALEGDFDLARFRSNTFELEWPPKSGRTQSFPEADRAAWFSLDEAAGKILSGQRPLLDALRDQLSPTAGQSY
jgi:predicted NUDIX family NTP pyrophosphohydrolase